MAGPSLQASFCCFFIRSRFSSLLLRVLEGVLILCDAEKKLRRLDRDGPASQRVCDVRIEVERATERAAERKPLQNCTKETRRDRRTSRNAIYVHAHSQIRHLKLSARERDERRKKVQEVNCRRLPPCAAADDELPPAENVNNINKIKKIL